VRFGRILEVAIRPHVRKEDWTRNLSKRAAMWLGANILLDQVNLPEEGLISSRSQPIIISSTHSLAGSLTLEPPFFSSRARVTFRSPAIMIFYGFFSERKD